MVLQYTSRPNELSLDHAFIKLANKAITEMLQEGLLLPTHGMKRFLRIKIPVFNFGQENHVSLKSKKRHLEVPKIEC